ncbi:unnamed protein product [Phaedon cochleariae]|uniref:Uncharacterized protein n=1 Tax=Phaedon cochleariae TaxID=80249 RepID=A0A9N9SDH6_PHACE|nr:unnamed protein product [Phaedon cochleariae]
MVITLSDQYFQYFINPSKRKNRNSTLANALLNLSMVSKITIEQKFLERGHTQVEADSIHSTIERKLRHTNISVPADYVAICRSARRYPRPYTVYYLGHGFFKDFSKLSFLKSLRPGKRVGDPHVTDIRSLKYTPDGTIGYKLRHSENYMDLQFSRVSKKTRLEQCCPFSELTALYDDPLAIKKEKFLHLQALKMSIPADYHNFYDNLSYH